MARTGKAPNWQLAQQPVRLSVNAFGDLAVGANGRVLLHKPVALAPIFALRLIRAGSRASPSRRVCPGFLDGD